MPNAPHILETALLLLAAFLIGCVAGYLLRWLAASRSRPAASPTVAPPAAAAIGDALVVAPRIEPITAPAPKLTPAQRLAAAAPEPVAELAAIPEVTTIQPAHVAGETTSGKVVPAPAELPEAPAVEPEPAAVEVVAAEVPPIDEAAHVVEPEQAAAPEKQPEAPAAIEIPWSELSGRPTPPPSVRDAEAEQAAMRAVEGGWTPRPAPRTTARRVELLEPIETGRSTAPAEASATETAGATPAEIEGALSAARSAVAAASAAAEAAVAEQELAPEVNEVPAPAPDEVSPRPGHRSPFGKPAGLDAPRDGHRDELRQIKGITPQIEQALNDLGVFHFDQIAEWDKKAIVWVDNHLALKGKLARERWIEQARELAKTRVSAFRAAKP